MTDRCFIMLKPMRAGLSGYARIQAEAGGASAFISARGLPVKRVNAYWMGGGAARAIASAQVNARGEAALEARLPDEISAPERLQALLIIGEGEGGKPVPLLIGLCARQSAGSLLDAKNALLALCERISRARAARNAADDCGNAAPSSVGANCVRPLPNTDMPTPQPARYPTPQIPEPIPPAPSVGANCVRPLPNTDEPAPIPHTPSVGANCVRPLPHADEPEPNPSTPSAGARPFARAVRVKPRAIEPTREIFLPAIDPSPYIQAEEPPPATSSAGASCVRPRSAALPRSRSSRPIDTLPALRYPPGFASLNARFAARIPENPLGMKGWRFVSLDERRAVYVGRQALDGRVVRIAYVIRGEQPPDDEKPYRRARGIDGDTFQVLIQRI